MNDLSPQDFDPETICVQVIARARILYETNEYPSNYEGQTFASARADALTFFHSNQFERMCALLNLPPWKVREIADVPQPTPLCRCENCRTDYREEARLVQSLPRQQRFRFAIGEKHIVLTEVAQSAQHAREVTASGVGVFRIALGAEPGHRVITGRIRGDFRHVNVSNFEVQDLQSTLLIAACKTLGFSGQSASMDRYFKHLHSIVAPGY